jgi:CheY-like chemotaxis protein
MALAFADDNASETLVVKRPCVTVTRECRVTPARRLLSPQSELEGAGMMQVAASDGLAIIIEHSVDPAPGARPRVLVVDDDDAVRSSFELALTDMALTLVTAKDGFEALEYLTGHHVDLVFLDLTMPRINGTKTLEILRDLQPNARVCIVTGYAEEHMSELVDLASDRLNFELFRKPLEIDDIRALVASMLSGRQPRRGKSLQASRLRELFPT